MPWRLGLLGVALLASGATVAPARAAAPGPIAISGDLRSDLIPVLTTFDLQDGRAASLIEVGPGWDPALSPDGSQLAYIGTQDGYDAVFVARPDGSGERRVSQEITAAGFWGGTCSADESRPVWSPDGRRIAFEVAFGPYCTPPARALTGRRPATARYTVHMPHRLALVDLASASARVLPVDGFAPRWSPDSSRFVYVERDSSCLCAIPGRTSALVRVDTGTIRSLGAGTEAAWSPGGGSLALPTGHGTVRVFDSDGVRTRTVRARSAVWTSCGLMTSPAVRMVSSPDGRRAAFRNASTIVVRTCHGQQATAVPPLTDPVSFAPHGAQLLVRRCLRGDCTLTILTGRRLVSLGMRAPHEPAWSPDGRRIVALVAGDGVAIADAATGLARTVATEAVSAPLWTSASTFAFTTHATGHESNVYTLDPSSGSPPELIASNAARAALSPDGRMLAYLKAPGIWVSEAAGFGARLLVTADATGLAWSPDGTRLAFSTTSQIDVAGLDGTVRRIATTMTVPAVSAWSPDGRWIAFTAVGARLVHPDGSENHLFLPLAQRLVWSPDGTSIAYTDGRTNGLTIADAAGATTVEIPGPVDFQCLAWDARSGEILALRPGRAHGGVYDFTVNTLVALTPDGLHETPLTDGLSHVDSVG